MAERGRASSWAMAKSTARTEVHVHTQVAKTPPGSRDMALGHTAPSEALLSMMDTNLLLLRVNTMRDVLYNQDAAQSGNLAILPALESHYQLCKL